MPLKPAFLDIILGGSVRAANSKLKRFDGDRQDTVRVFSQVCDSPRCMDKEELVTVFQTLGSLSNLMRLELCCYKPKSKALVLPAIAITETLQRARSLRDFLLIRVRVAGNCLEKGSMTHAILRHPSMKRLFLSDCHPTLGSAPLVPFLEAASVNPSIDAITVSDCHWAGHSLYHVQNHEASRLKSLKLRGALFLDSLQWHYLFQGLQSCSSLKELRITDFALSPRMGVSVARLLMSHQGLDDVVLELTTLADTIPVCAALSTNTTLKRLELLVYCPESTTSQSFVTNLFADVMMSQNYTLQHFLLRTPASIMGNTRLEFFVRLNKCARRAALLKSENPLKAEDWVDVLIENKNDVSVLHYILLLNPAICQNLPLTAFRKPAATRRRCRKKRRMR